MMPHYGDRIMFQEARPRAFRCGFESEGKSNREYMDHISTCLHRDCCHRWENRDALVRYFVSKYGRIATNATPATSPARQALPVASAGARSNRHNPSSH